MNSFKSSKCRAAPRPLPLTLFLVLPVWSGHSCPLLLTLLLIEFRENRGCPHNRGRAALQRRVKLEKGNQALARARQQK